MSLVQVSPSLAWGMDHENGCPTPQFLRHLSTGGAAGNRDGTLVRKPFESAAGSSAGFSGSFPLHRKRLKLRDASRGFGSPLR